ncbi:hypothetical protein F5144DRAFT_618018 [Chaetomium tenue]|uniref:Uncharacterized protein n=1 Tax=Chaetomium tenue TaxID=1854479 RepID=A0ACB7PGH0_9PEZI|nr:hypothetical protein F5144DRAFT_618018 [Chaetomium globosum]
MNITAGKTTPFQAVPLHRHQSSLEEILDFSSTVPLGAEQRGQARRKFYRIVQHFEAESTQTSKTKTAGKRGTRYNQPLLIRLTYENARSEESQDVFLRAFFRSMALSLDGEDLKSDLDLDFGNEAVEADLRSSLIGFAEYLIDNFFLPLKASTKKTPQPSPAYHSAVMKAQGIGLPQGLVGTPERLSALRGACLCARSTPLSATRYDNHGQDARDDDGRLLVDEVDQFDVLEVAHIMPHALTKAKRDSELNSTREAALAILNMFDMGVVHLIDGGEIDRPRNALTLTTYLHRFFGNFDVYLPITRTLHLAETNTIDPPSPRLLAVHSAIARILHFSAAGAYIDRILRDAEEYGIKADGSTELGRLVNLGLGGWVDGVGVRP